MGNKAGIFEDIVDAFLAYGVISRYNSQRTSEEEIGDLRADGANDGKKQARKRKLISVVDSEEESDVEITPPTRSSKPRK
ncbi:hypothetical protein YC2023_103466 [Brassica napus]